MNHSLSVQVLQKPNSQVIMYAHYFSKPVTRIGKKTNLIFDYLPFELYNSFCNWSKCNAIHNLFKTATSSNWQYLKAQCKIRDYYFLMIWKIKLEVIHGWSHLVYPQKYVYIILFLFELFKVRWIKNFWICISMVF